MDGLEKQVVWQTLLQVLALEPSRGSLPCASRCPQCRAAALTTFHDNVSGGCWHHCSACGLAVDSLELAGVAWRMTAADAVSRLGNQHVLPAGIGADAIARYAAGPPAARRLAKTVWDGAGSLLLASARLKAVFGAHDAIASLWRDRGHRLVRLTSADKLTEAGLHVTMAKKTDKNEIVVLPLADLPGRIAAFLLVGLDDQEPVAIRHEFSGSGDALGLDLALTTTAAEPIFVIGDLVLAAYLHVRHFALHGAPLPLVACRDAGGLPPVLVDLSQTRRTLVFAERRDAELFAMASRLNAHAAAQADLPENKEKPAAGAKVRKVALTYHGSPLPWLLGLTDIAKPWRELLHDELTKLPAQAASLLLENCKLPGPDVEALLNAEDLQGKLRQGGFFKAGCTVSLGGSEIREDADGWKLARTGELLSDVIIRIDRVLTRTGTTNTWYRGRLIYRREEIPFVTDSKTFERQAFRFARQRIVDLGKGLPRFKESWQSRAFELSLLFHQPEAVESMPGCGWDADRQRFLLPDFALNLGGQVVDLDVPILADGPPLGLAKPVRLSAGELAELDTEPGHPLWPVILTVAYNLMAPVYRQPPRGLLIEGDVGGTCIEIAAAAGCPVLDAHSPDVRQAAWTSAVTSQQAWHRGWCGWLEESRPLIARLPETVCRLVYINGDWFYLRSLHTPLTDARALRIVNRLIPDFLHYLVSNRLTGGLWGDSLTKRCSQALLEYLADRGAPTANAAAAMTRLIGHRNYSGFGIGRILSFLFHAGAVVLSAGAARPHLLVGGRPRTLVHIDEDANTAWIPQAGLNATLRDRGYPTLRDGALLQRLQPLRGSSALRGEEDRNGSRGWVFRLDWLNRHMRAAIGDAKKQLKLAT